MRITDLLTERNILLDYHAKSKNDVLDTLIDLHYACGAITDKELFRQAILAREAQSSTAIERGIAVPHAKSSCVTRPSLAVAVLDNGVEYDAMDGRPSRLFFMIAAPEQGDAHLEILSRLMGMLMDEEFTKRLQAGKTPGEFMAIIDEAEVKKFGSVPPADKPRRILAVTACPTGIAHTFMAAEALVKAAGNLGIDFKVETNGSSGVKNPLTSKDIADADGVIIAADKQVELARFSGKKVLFAPVKDGIHRPEELLRQVCADHIPVFEYTGSSAKKSEGDSFGHGLYKHLMNGISNMLPFIIAGGLLISLAFLVDDYSINPDNFGSNTPLAALFKTMGAASFSFMFPALAGFIAMSIADRPGLVVGFVGGALAAAGTSFESVTMGTTPVSGGFLAALLAGFVGGYLMLLLRKVLSLLPESLEGIKPILLFPLLGVLLISLFMYAVNPFMGGINTGITNMLHSMGGASKIFLGLLLGAMMSSDMGGPINKAAYIFGTAAITSGNYDIMASVMIGGMTPPMIVAMSTIFFRSKWTREERQNGAICGVMSLCFITESAIPFAAADPLRILPACAIGSAVSGGLSMFFGCALRAPHGGIFVFPLVTNSLFYLASLIIGSIVGMLILSAIKPRLA